MQYRWNLPPPPTNNDRSPAFDWLPVEFNSFFNILKTVLENTLACTSLFWIYLDYYWLCMHLCEEPSSVCHLGTSSIQQVFLEKGACEYNDIFKWIYCTNQSIVNHCKTLHPRPPKKDPCCSKITQGRKLLTVCLPETSKDICGYMKQSFSVG